MNQIQLLKKNADYVKVLLKDLQQKTEIDQKIEYFKASIKAYDLKLECLSKKIDAVEIKYKNDTENYDLAYDLSNLIIEKVNTDDAIFEKKTFFEMWLKRGEDWQKTFEITTKDCNDNFDKVEELAKELAEKNLKIKSHIQKFEKEENPEQKLKNEYYLLLKYEVFKATGKLVGIEFEDFYKK